MAPLLNHEPFDAFHIFGALELSIRSLACLTGVSVRRPQHIRTVQLTFRRLDYRGRVAEIVNGAAEWR